MIFEGKRLSTQSRCCIEYGGASNCQKGKGKMAPWSQANPCKLKIQKPEWINDYKDVWNSC